MRRFAALGLAVILSLIWSGCGGGSAVATQIALTPTAMSLHWGETRQLAAQPEDASGNALATQAVTYSSSNSAIASVTSTGVICGGSWDAAGIVCSAPSPLPTCSASSPCTATITASIASGVNAKMTALVHPTVAAVAVSSPVAAGDCLSQGGTAVLTAAACSQPAIAGACPAGSDITGQVFNDSLAPAVDPFSWGISPSAVATASCTTGNTCTITAAAPGQATVTASFYSAPGGSNYQQVTSLPITLTTCPVKSLALHTASGSDTSATIGSGTQALTVDALDTKGVALSAPAVQLNSSQPASSTVSISSAAGTATMVAAGTSTITASCTPSTCNNGLYPVFSNPFLLTVSGTSSTAIYAASKSGTTLMPYDATSGTAGTAVTLPYTPNSILFTPNGNTLYLGSASGLMVVGVTSTTSNTIGSNVSVPGTVLAISPDSTTVLIADPTGTIVYVYTGATAAVRTLSIPGARAAAYAPDGSRAYIATPTGIYLYTTATGVLANQPIGSVTTLDFLSQGSFAYLAGGGANVSVLAICNNAAVVPASAVTPQPTGVPKIIRSLPNAKHVLTANSPNLDDITVTEGAPIGASTSTSCQPALTNTSVSRSFGLTSFTATQLLVSPDSTKAYILASDTGSLLAYDVATQTPSAIALGGTALTTGGFTLDSAYLFVGVAGTNTIHKIAVATGTDAITPISPGFQPDLVAVRPK